MPIREQPCATLNRSIPPGLPTAVTSVARPTRPEAENRRDTGRSTRRRRLVTKGRRADGCRLEERAGHQPPVSPTPRSMNHSSANTDNIQGFSGVAALMLWRDDPPSGDAGETRWTEPRTGRFRLMPFALASSGASRPAVRSRIGSGLLVESRVWLLVGPRALRFDWQQLIPSTM